MPEKIDPDLTLPSLVASLPGQHRKRQLALTVVFHPRTSRIGETALVPPQDDRSPWILGRRSPLFKGRDMQAARPLDEPHVSRRALQLQFNGKRAIIRRLAASSRCQLGGVELHDSVELDQGRLCEGVPLMLGHTVVLLLRLLESSDTAAGEEHGSGLLKGGSAYMQHLGKQVAQLGASDLDVLIRGETGTGKELVATAIHAASSRAQAALISVNMSAIPTELAPAALFGSARGAFTGADRAAAGYFQQAQGGTLFLDEVGDTPAAVQPQLLRALQQREIQSVGGPIRQVDVRVISATDADLEGENCDFKAALRHRLSAGEVQLLPLRQHPEDIGELLLYFLATDASQAGHVDWLPQEDSAAPEIAAWAELFYHFVSHHWPGNVRELANFARQVVLASERRLTLPDNVLAALRKKKQAGSRDQAPAASAPSQRRAMQDIDQAEFDTALQANRFEVAPAARQLGVSRQSIYRRMEESPGHRLASQIPRQELLQVLAAKHGDCPAAALFLRVSLSGLRARLRHLAIEH